MADINWTATISIKGENPIIVTAGPLSSEAVGKISVKLVADPKKEVAIDIQSGSPSSIQLLVITASQYGDADPKKQISYKASDGANDSAVIPLTGPQFFSGGSVSLLGANVKTLKFTNASSADADIEILVANQVSH